MATSQLHVLAILLQQKKERAPGGERHSVECVERVSANAGTISLRPEKEQNLVRMKSMGTMKWMAYARNDCKYNVCKKRILIQYLFNVCSVFALRRRTNCTSDEIETIQCECDDYSRHFPPLHTMNECIIYECLNAVALTAHGVEVISMRRDAEFAGIP